MVDEAQQFGTDREVTAIAMLPPTSFTLWTADAQQTPGGITKGHNQYARSRQQLMARRHALRCPDRVDSTQAAQRIADAPVCPVIFKLYSPLLMPTRDPSGQLRKGQPHAESFFFLRLPFGHHGPVSELS